ncbi:MAG: glutamine-hydrolyzing GMP synthase, partial [Planctomycetota bacterium]
MKAPAVKGSSPTGAARKHDRILVVDFGSQYTQLIARRIREERVYSEVAGPAQALARAQGEELRGLILSGGPASAYGKDAPSLPAAILRCGVPILGICYGMQWLCEALGGKVVLGENREFGFTRLRVNASQGLFRGVDPETTVWMSHGDRVERLPLGFARLAETSSCPEAAVGNPAQGFYGLQFHPEVAHTREGGRILANFLFSVCECRGDWSPQDLARELVDSVGRQVGD